MTHLPLLVVAAFTAGVMNAVAGGGSFLTFPALVFAGVPPVMASATNTVALFPAAFAAAWGYRHDLPRLGRRVAVRSLMAVSMVGGGGGALLLIFTPEHTFSALIPWLLLAATLLFASGRHATPWLKRRMRFGPLELGAVQFAIAVYGGYFGGAIGILMLASFALFGMEDISAMNGLKTLLNGMMNGVAVVCFVAAGKVAWGPAAVMLGAAMAGGYAGARASRRMNPAHVRLAVVTVGLAMSAVFFTRG